MTPIYDALRAAPPRSSDPLGNDAVAPARVGLRLVPPVPSMSKPVGPIRVPVAPSAFPARVLSTERTPPWTAGQLP